MSVPGGGVWCQFLSGPMFFPGGGVWCHFLSGSMFLRRGVFLQRGSPFAGFLPWEEGSLQRWDPPVAKQMPVKTLPSLAVGRNPNLPQSRIWNSGELRKVTVRLDMSLNIEIYPRFLIFRRLLHHLLSSRAVLELSGRDSTRVRLPPWEKYWYCKGLFRRSPSPCPSKSPSKFNIVPMVADTLMDRWVWNPFFPSKIIQGTAHKSGHLDSSCKRCLMHEYGRYVTEPVVMWTNETRIDLAVHRHGCLYWRVSSGDLTSGLVADLSWSQEYA